MTASRRLATSSATPLCDASHSWERRSSMRRVVVVGGALLLAVGREHVLHAGGVVRRDVERELAA